MAGKPRLELLVILGERGHLLRGKLHKVVLPVSVGVEVGMGGCRV